MFCPCRELRPLRPSGIESVPWAADFLQERPYREEVNAMRVKTTLKAGGTPLPA